MKQEELMQKRNWRYILPNEIIIEFDSKPEWNVYEGSPIAINETAYNLMKDKSNFQIFSHNGKSPHLHIKNFDRNLNEQEKIAFIKKYVPKRFFPFVDLSLCKKKPCIAKEFELHWKYGRRKLLLGEWNVGMSNIFPSDLEIEEPQQEKKIAVNGSGITAKIIKKVSIINVAKDYGLDVDRTGKCLCPFHPDNETPSLKFYDSQGRFHCFGCNKDGNIIEFLKQLKMRGITKNG